MKKFAAPLLHSLALTTGVSKAKAKAIHAGRVLCLHGVGDEDCTAAALEKQLAYLAGNFSVVSLGTLLDRLAVGTLKDEIALTFDDGLRNNLTVAYPLLKKFNAPATFFVCPGLIENGRWLWTHETRARLNFLHGTVDEPLLDHLKTLGLKERIAAEDDLRRCTANFQPSPAQRQRYDLMTWDELRQFDPVLVTIGSHSLTHPILSTLTGAELAGEIAESRRMLENKLQRPVELFCYPNGAHNPEVARLAAAHYRAACVTKAGFVRPGCNWHQLPRIGIAPNLAYLAWRLHRPGA